MTKKQKIIWNHNTTVEDLAQGILNSQRAALGLGITLVEGELPSQKEKAQKLIKQLMPHRGKCLRIGVSGIPGVGKSTFIESFGTYLTKNENKKIAVLAVDPTSEATGGSILGDKTRMEKLSSDPMAFIRPSPSSGSLGGVAKKTREAMILCEAYGNEVILIETVGVGQSEAVVADMVDFFILLMQPGAGDELQGIKRGILELADLVAINKADGPNLELAKSSLHDYQQALAILRHSDEDWNPPVICCSALEKQGLDEIWAMVENYRKLRLSNGMWDAKRKKQDYKWLWEFIKNKLIDDFLDYYDLPKSKKMLEELEGQVQNGQVDPYQAGISLLNHYYSTSH